jgi:hypothetical protein
MNTRHPPLPPTKKLSQRKPPFDCAALRSGRLMDWGHRLTAYATRGLRKMSQQEIALRKLRAGIQPKEQVFNDSSDQKRD